MSTVSWPVLEATIPEASLPKPRLPWLGCRRGIRNPTAGIIRVAQMWPFGKSCWMPAALSALDVLGLRLLHRDTVFSSEGAACMASTIACKTLCRTWLTCLFSPAPLDGLGTHVMCPCPLQNQAEVAMMGANYGCESEAS